MKKYNTTDRIMVLRKEFVNTAIFDYDCSEEDLYEMIDQMFAQWVGWTR